MQQTEYYRFSPGILAEFRAKADEAQFWSALWGNTDYDLFFQKYQNGYLADFERVFKKYLPKSEPVLEAGCGRGQYVYALSKLGYKIYGIDFSKELVDGIKHTNIGIDVTHGDVRDLKYDDSILGAYISLGVVEHFYEGMEDILKEAKRVLKKNGLLLLSVPHYNSFLQKFAKKQFPNYKNNLSPSKKPFYQFYFTEDVIKSKIRKNDFKIVDSFYYGGVYGVKRSMPLFLFLYNKSKMFRYIAHKLSRLNSPQWLIKRFSHMVMVVAEKI